MGEPLPGSDLTSLGKWKGQRTWNEKTQVQVSPRCDLALLFPLKQGNSHFNIHYGGHDGQIRRWKPEDLINYNHGK